MKCEQDNRTRFAENGVLKRNNVPEEVEAMYRCNSCHNIDKMEIFAFTGLIRRKKNNVNILYTKHTTCARNCVDYDNDDVDNNVRYVGDAFV